MSTLLKKTQCFYGNTEQNFNQYNNVVLCSDKNVVRGLGVTIASVARHNQNCAFHIFFNGELTQDDTERFYVLASRYKQPIYMYWIDDTLLQGMYSTQYISITAYYRFLVPYVLEKFNIRKCLYLDTDILCLQNLQELFHKNLENKIAYVINNSSKSIEWWKKHCLKIGMKKNLYFNSGVMLLNIDKYVNQDIGWKAVKLANSQTYKHMDQDVLNILLEGNVIFDTSYTFNCSLSVHDDELPKKIAIVHFTTGNKPWKLFTSHWGDINPKDKAHSWKFKYYKLWRQCSAESPWADVPYDIPTNAHEWRYLSNMYFKNYEYGKAISSYWQYLIGKLWFY